jgi:hypothetical protein
MAAINIPSVERTIDFMIIVGKSLCEERVSDEGKRACGTRRGLTGRRRTGQFASRRRST